MREEEKKKRRKEKKKMEYGIRNTEEAEYPTPNTQHPTPDSSFITHHSSLYSTPWHRASFDRFLREGLPQLLVSRLPLVRYQVESAGAYACCVTVGVGMGAETLNVTFADVPQPDAQGVFRIGGREYTVLPLASSDELDMADIQCVGDLLMAFCAARLGEAPTELEWNENLLHAWLPLETWVEEFVRLRGQALPRMSWETEVRWLERQTQLRRIAVPEKPRMFTPGHFGRVCPLETPEGPNIGRILVVAMGAAIRDGKLIVVDDSPLGNLGANARMIPFLEHDDPCRLVMGVNMLRQWITPPDPEPALIQTGSEPPDAPEFWCGRNLLTAYVSGGLDTFEDGILISQSCAKRLNYPFAVQPGDKLSNRHGSKGVIARIVPDDEMPHLIETDAGESIETDTAEGEEEETQQGEAQQGEMRKHGSERRTPVELVFSPMSLHSRMVLGQIREAVLSCVAKQEGQPLIAPPFAAPKDEELQARIVAAGLPPDGMRMLSVNRHGPPMSVPSTVGWVYWGRLHHLASDKIHATATPAHCSRIGQAEFHALGIADATENIRETFNTRAAARMDAPLLAERLIAGPVAQSAPPSPQWADVARRLAVGGIVSDFSEHGLRFRLAQTASKPNEKADEEVIKATAEEAGEGVNKEASEKLGEEPEGNKELEGEILRLAEAAPHPWNPEITLTAIGAFVELPEYGELVEANGRLTRMLAGQAPDSLLLKARTDMQTRLQAFFAVLLTPDHLEFGARTQFSGRAVATIGKGLSYEQVGLPEEIAWTLFAPLVAREMRSVEAVQAHSEAAAQVLDRIMARSWVLLNRAPTITPTGIVAFHPVRVSGQTIQAHPFTCSLMELDFDGDTVSVFLPVTEAAQMEAGQKLTIAGHLRRDVESLNVLRPLHDARLGLAFLVRTPTGRAEIEHILEQPLSLQNGLLTRGVLEEPLRQRLLKEGHAAVEPVLDILHRLTLRGFEAARHIGGGYGPFLGRNWPAPVHPIRDAPNEWNAWLEEFAARIAERMRQPESLSDPVLLTLASGARGGMRLLLKAVAAQGVVAALNGSAVTIRHGYREGLTPPEFLMNCIGSREGMAQGITQWVSIQKEMFAEQAHTGYGVLSRAMRAPNPGLIFARAALAQETDPLRDAVARLFVG